MRELKRFAWFAAALVLIFAGNTAAGDFASTTVAFDLEVVNLDANEIPTNEGNRDTTGLDLPAGTGGRFEVEVHIVPVPATPLVSIGMQFNVDSNVVVLNRVTNEGEDGWVDNVDPPGFVSFTDAQTLGFNLAYGTGTGLTDPNFSNGYVLPSSYAGTMRWQTTSNITSADELVFDPFYVAFSDTSGGKDTIYVAPQLSATSSQVQLGGSATITLGSYVPGFVINGTAPTIDWVITATGNASVAVEGQSGLSFSTPATETSIVLNSSGSGNVSVAVAATIGLVTYNLAAPVVFEEATPVELASFGGEVVESQVVLNWTTGSQTNNAGWRVLRSEDGENFAAVGEFVSGAGTSEELLNYSFSDGQLPEAESVFYVLEQVDLDGTVHLSNPVEILLGARFQDIPESFGISAYPNPFNPSTTVSYDLPTGEQVSIVIYDVLGQEVRRLVDDQRAAGRHNIRWDARDNTGRAVGSGVYIARIDAGSFTQSQKMLLLK